jgi:hypothetical protein
LIRQVIENKPKNRPEAYDYVEYKEYDKMHVLYRQRISRVFRQKFFKKYKFVIDNRDSTIVPENRYYRFFGRKILTILLPQKSRKETNEIVLGQRGVNFGPAVDNEGVKQYFKHLYNKVDIYDNDINLITNNFLSPIC